MPRTDDDPSPSCTNANQPSNSTDHDTPPAEAMRPTKPPPNPPVSPCHPRAEHRCRAQRRRGVVTPGATVPTTKTSVERGGGVRKQYFQGWWSGFAGRGWRRPASASRHRAERSCLPTNAGEGMGPFETTMDTTTTAKRGRRNTTSKGGIDDNNNNNKPTKRRIDTGHCNKRNRARV